MQPFLSNGMKNAKDNIASHLSYSEKLSEITAGHQKETAQLLENMEQLQDDVRVLLTENESLTNACEQKDTRIAELEARVAELEARPQFEVAQYVENQTIKKQVLSYSVARRKKQIYTPNQLPLWDPSALSL